MTMAMIDTKVYPANVEQTARQFIRRVLSYHDLVSTYHSDELLHAMARSLVPTEDLESKARARVEGHAPGTPEFKRAFFLELLAWFKYQFFKWTDKPPCCQCEGATECQGTSAQPTQEEVEDDARNVELYACNTCHALTRFPRYNNPGKLLQTRKGRCGEWANCFHLIANAFGYECRAAQDWSDHVWMEVYCPVAKRWVHVDACENAYDKPLLYEGGWGKKLSYVIAVADDHITDVTWRYSKHHRTVLGRRLLIKENDLINFLETWNAQRQASLSQDRRTLLKYRLLADLAEFLVPRDYLLGQSAFLTFAEVDRDTLNKEKFPVGVKPEIADKLIAVTNIDTCEDALLYAERVESNILHRQPASISSGQLEIAGEDQGRVSGSMAWRAERGELGDLQKQQDHQPYTILIEDAELAKG